MRHANGTERVRWVALVALMLQLTAGYNTADLVISTPEELKPMVIRVSHPVATCFTPDLQAAMPHAINPKVTDKPELIVEKLVRVSCGKHKCARPQPIWWIEEHIKVVQLLAKMRKSRKLPGDEGSGGKKKFIIFSTQKPLLPPPPAGTDRGKADKWKLVDNLAIGEARHLNALVVFNKEIIYGYRAFASNLPMRWMRGWPAPLSHNATKLGNMKLTLQADSIEDHPPPHVGARKLTGLWPFRGSVTTTGSPLNRQGQELTDRRLTRLHSRGKCAVAQVQGGVPKVKSAGYMAAACGTIVGCSKRDWSTLLLGLKQANEALGKEGHEHVTLRIAVRIQAIIGQSADGSQQLSKTPIPDCTTAESCTVVSMGEADYKDFISRATVTVLPLAKASETGVGLRTVVDSLSAGIPVLSADVPALDGYVKHAFNGVLVGVDSSLRAVHAYGDAIYQIFSDHGDPSLDYSLRSLRTACLEHLGDFRADAVMRQLGRIVAPFTMHLHRRQAPLVTAAVASKVNTELLRYMAKSPPPPAPELGGADRAPATPQELAIDHAYAAAAAEVALPAADAQTFAETQAAARDAVPSVDLRPGTWAQEEAAAEEAAAAGLQVTSRYEERELPMENLQQTPVELAEPGTMEAVVDEASAGESAEAVVAEVDAVVPVRQIVAADAAAVEPEPSPEWPAEEAAPVEEAAAAPVEEAAAAPVQEAPAAPVEEAPAAPVEEAPAAPVEEAPAAPVEEAPAAPVEEAPAAPVEEAPAAPVMEAPAAPVQEAAAMAQEASPMEEEAVPKREAAASSEVSSEPLAAESVLEEGVSATRLVEGLPPTVSLTPVVAASAEVSVEDFPTAADELPAAL